MDPLTRTQHQIAVDRALAALEGGGGSPRAMSSHLTEPIAAPAYSVAHEELVEAFKRYRERAPE